MKEEGRGGPLRFRHEDKATAAIYRVGELAPVEYVRKSAYNTDMGLKSVKKAVLECIAEGRIQFEARNNIDVKNLLQTGAVTFDEVSAMIRKSRGDDYNTGAHHSIPEITVHIFKPLIKGAAGNERWYIKCYLLAPDVWFISVHQ